MANQPRPPTYCWTSSLLPKRPREKEFEHIGSSFQNTGARSSDFIINPDWVSEGMNKASPFGGRRYRPWSYEFQGARYWPYGTVEARQSEESDYRRAVASAPVPLALEPRAVQGQERWSLSTPIRFVAQPSRSAWRSQTIPGCPARESDNTNCTTEPCPVSADPTRFQKIVTGTDQLFVGGGDAVGNAARYQGDSTYSNNYSRNIPSYPGQCSGSDTRSYGQHFPMVIPQREPSQYMNFVNSEWFRS